MQMVYFMQRCQTFAVIRKKKKKTFLPNYHAIFVPRKKSKVKMLVAQNAQVQEAIFWTPCGFHAHSFLHAHNLQDIMKQKRLFISQFRATCSLERKEG